MTTDEKQMFNFVDHYMTGPYYTDFLDLSFPGRSICSSLENHCFFFYKKRKYSRIIANFEKRKTGLKNTNK